MVPVLSRSVASKQKKESKKVRWGREKAPNDGVGDTV